MTGESLYVLVHFWRTEAWRAAGNPPDFVNDFVLGLETTGRRVVERRDEAGGRTLVKRASDGVFVDPRTQEIGTIYETAVVAVDVRAEVRAVIERYIRRRARGALAGRPYAARQDAPEAFVRDQVDRKGLLVALAGADIEGEAV